MSVTSPTCRSPIGSNWYLASVTDCYSRKLAGWALADHMRTEFIAAALTDAAATRGTLAGAVFRCDHGSVYISKSYAKMPPAQGHPVHGCCGDIGR